MTDVELRIKRHKTCIFALSEIKDITDHNHHYRIFKKYINLCAMCENHLYTERSYFGFWCWTQFSMLIKVPEFAWTTVNLYSSWESVCPTSGIKLNTKKRSLCPVNCDRPFCFSEFFKATDAGVRIKRPKTCIFVLSKRKDILIRTIITGSWEKYLPLCNGWKSSVYGAFVFVFGFELDSRC